MRRLVRGSVVDRRHDAREQFAELTRKFGRCESKVSLSRDSCVDQLSCDYERDRTARCVRGARRRRRNDLLAGTTSRASRGIPSVGVERSSKQIETNQLVIRAHGDNHG